VTDLYAILGLPRDAPRMAIRKAYRDLAKTKHPDAGGSEAEFELVKLAHDVLTDPERRALYDSSGRIENKADMNAAALGVIAAALDQILQHPGFGPQTAIVDCVRQKLKEQRASFEQNIAQAKADIGKTDHLLGRFKKRRKKDEPDDDRNVFEMTLRGRKAAIERAILNFETQAKLADDALEMIKGYTFTPEQIQQVTLITRGNWASTWRF
jgi:curved DNA-binding protein CbpA